MKLTATVTALRTNGRMEITIVTSATGLEQCIVADNGDSWTLDDELVVLVMTKGETDALYRNFQGYRSIEGNAITDRIFAQLRPDEPPPFMEPSPDAQDAWARRHCVQPDEVKA